MLCQELLEQRTTLWALRTAESAVSQSGGQTAKIKVLAGLCSAEGIGEDVSQASLLCLVGAPVLWGHETVPLQPPPPVASWAPVSSRGLLFIRTESYWIGVT